jgi:carbohydrate-selective porin OprB
MGREEKEQVESDINQLAGSLEKQRLVLTTGKLSVVDIFDNNAFAHDGRKDFFNWVNVAQGAFDYAADVRGYTWGAALEYYHYDWVFRAGRFAVPIESNGLQLNYSLMNFHGDQIEIEHDHEIAGETGKLRLLAFRNRELMGRFDDALAYAAANGGLPNVDNVRRINIKHGYGVNLEQNLTSNLGAFARTSWNDGGTEMFSYTEVERSTQAGISLRGTQWKRAQDTLGLAFVQNGLSKAHQAYLSAGGTGFLIGDGRLNYRPERVFESYYSFAIANKSWLTFDYQHFNNPAYNADRGPLYVWGVRLHQEF